MQTKIVTSTILVFATLATSLLAASETRHGYNPELMESIEKMTTK